MVTASIVLLYISYSIPIVCLLYRGRKNIPHGPFWTGKFGLFANIVLLCWTAFTVVMYSFPAIMPAEAGSEFRFPFRLATFPDLFVPPSLSWPEHRPFVKIRVNFREFR